MADLLTNAQLAQLINDALSKWNAREAEQYAWVSGSATGGPNGDGRYPLSNGSGGSSLIDSPAKLADLLNGPAALAGAARDAALTFRDAAESAATAASTDKALANNHKLAAQDARDLAAQYRNEIAALLPGFNANASMVQAASLAVAADVDLMEALLEEGYVARDAAVTAQTAAEAAAALAATFNPNDYYTKVAADGRYLQLTNFTWANLSDKPATFAPSAHTHLISEITGLQTALDGKQAAGSYAAAVHSHVIGDVTGLQAALDGKQAAGSYAAAVHSHVIGDVTGLQAALDGKAATSHTHSYLPLTGGTLSGILIANGGVWTNHVGYNPAGDGYTLGAGWVANYGMSLGEHGGNGTGLATMLSGYSGLRFATSSTTRLYVNSAGNVIASVDLRAPIFYDNDNTAFFLDPSSTSRMSGINLNVLNNPQGFRVMDFDGPDYTLLRGPDSAIRFYIGRDNVPTYYDNDAHYFRTDGGAVTQFTVTGNGNAIAYADMRAPVFYDSNNTGYYVDLNTTECSIRTAGYWIADSTPWGGDINGKIQYHGHNWYFSAGGSWIFRASSGGQPFEVTQGGVAIAYADMRAPTFYDNNNTAFYTDPAGTSNISGLLLSGRDMRRYGTNRWIEFTVGGDANTYYPVLLQTPFYLFEFAKWSITRHYADTAPWDPIGTGVHRGGLTFTWCWSGDGAWGGNDKAHRVEQFHESYTTMVAGMSLSVNGMIVWLRGGGAVYKLHGPGGLDNTVSVNLSTYTASNGATFPPRSYDAATVNTEIMARFPIRNSGSGGELWDGNTRVLSENRWINSKYFGDNGHIYGTTFYDAGNGGYYLDPDATSNLYTITLASQLFVNGDARAPIFYDNNDTARYLDPNGTSRLGAVEAYTSMQNFGDFYARSNYTVLNSAGTGWNTVIDRNGGDGWIVHGGNSIRAPIFYDSNDTNYYLDPNGTSRTWKMVSRRFTNLEDVSADNAFGLFFSNNESTAYAIYREPGGWVHPYPDLRIGFHTGIKIGANASYEGIRFYTDYDMSTQVMSVNNGSDPLGGGNVYVNQSLQAGSSLRAPILYDSNDTGYYIDPNGASRMSSVTFDGGSMVASNGDFTARRSGGTTGVYYFGNGTPYLYWNGSDYIFASAGPTINSLSMRAGVFYDNDNTGYYLDAATTGTSLNVAGSIVAAGNVTAYSDARLKDNIQTISGALSKVQQITGVTYTRNDLTDKTRRYAGLIAQDVQKVLPEAVKDMGGTLGVDYSATIGLLVEAIKELTAEIETLKSKG